MKEKGEKKEKGNYAIFQPVATSLTINIFRMNQSISAQEMTRIPIATNMAAMSDIWKKFHFIGRSGI